MKFCYNQDILHNSYYITDIFLKLQSALCDLNMDKLTWTHHEVISVDNKVFRLKKLSNLKRIMFIIPNSYIQPTLSSSSSSG